MPPDLGRGVSTRPAWRVKGREDDEEMSARHSSVQPRDTARAIHHGERGFSKPLALWRALASALPRYALVASKARPARPAPRGRAPGRDIDVLEQVRTPGLLQRPPARPPELLQRRVPQGVFGQHDGGDSRPQDAARLHLSVASV